MAFRTRNVVSLCAGCGGLELGIGLALRLLGEGARGICYVEREAAAAASLVASMEAGWLHPAPVWSDLLTFDARPWHGLVHILASGDPCQDNSVAGKRAGSDGQRFLAPEVIRIAGECGPDLIFRENVPGNADGQLEAIVPALERLGYCVAAGIFSSAETGNTMRRERLFIMAKRLGDGHRGQYRSGENPAAAGEAQGPGDERERLRHIAGGSGEELARATLQRPREAGRDFGRSAERSGGSVGELGSAFGGGDGRHTADAGRGSIGRDAADRTGGGSVEAMGSTASTGLLPRTHAGIHSVEEGAGPRDAESERRSGDLGSPGSAEPQGQQRGQHYTPGRQVTGRSSALSGRTILPPAVIPGPTDSRWVDILDRWPELQPALSKEEAESHVRRGIDAVANRVERLRATGNGVDPVVAAYAFLSLGALLDASGAPRLASMTAIQPAAA